MANQDHIERLFDRGPGLGWNGWRREHPHTQPDFRGADFSGKNISGATQFRKEGPIVYTMMDLSGADLRNANLSKTDLRGASFENAQLDGADLTQALLGEANFTHANLQHTSLAEATLVMANFSGTNVEQSDLRDAFLMRADLTSANFSRSDLSGANLTEAKLFATNLRDAKLIGAILANADIRNSNFIHASLESADLRHARLIDTDFTEANLSEALVFGISAWGLKLNDACQRDLTVTKPDEPIITIDNLEVAQFIYMLLNNEKIRDIIDTITSKVVLILGRFSSERKILLNAIRDELRRKNYLPVLFDFDKPVTRDITETISTLAHMARFVIADLTEARSVPQELLRIVPQLPSVPVKPLIQTGVSEYAMFEHFRRFPSVLEIYRYTTVASLILSLTTEIIDPAEKKAKELIPPT
jgi:uncharacterized protein YjbI with pentapeptide repeats